MKVEIHNVDPGAVTDPKVQVALLCKAIAHADRSPGAALRALLQLAYELGNHDALEGAAALVNAASIAAFETGVSRAELLNTAADGYDLIRQDEREHPRMS